MSKNPTAQEMLRGATDTSTLGTVGHGLSGPDQFDALHVIAKKKVGYLDVMGRRITTDLTGEIRRIAFGDNHLELGVENTDPANAHEPTHDGVTFSLQELVFKALLSKKAAKFAAHPGYERQFNEEAAKAYFRALLRVLWMGDTASADPSLNMIDGWRASIVASGNAVDGSAINGGDFSPAHLYAALNALGEDYAENLSDGYAWVMNKLKLLDIQEELSGRATGYGDEMLRMNPGEKPMLMGLPVEIVGFLGNTEVILCKPEETIAVMDDNTFALETETGGKFKERRQVLLLGSINADAAVAEVEGTARIHTLNAS